jgi:CheY-like chemotaxis protein
MSARPDVTTSKVHRLQPLRVLLCGTDRGFVRVTSFLLSRRGYAVAQAVPSDTVTAAERHRADVVVLETNGSRVLAARKLAALQALGTPPSVLVVIDDGDDERWDGLPTVRKWTSLDDLIGRIETAALSRPMPAPSTDARGL